MWNFQLPGRYRGTAVEEDVDIDGTGSIWRTRAPAAERKLVEAKELLLTADAFNWLVVESEKLQLRLHYEVKRATRKAEELKK